MKENKIIKAIKNQNKLYLFSKILFSTLFALTIFFDSALVFVQNLRATVNEIYFSNITLKNILVFIVTWIITFVLLTIIEYVVSKIEDEIYIKQKNERKKKRVFLIIFCILLLLWMPYILSYFPGGIFADTQASIKQCLHLQSYDNMNPLAYTLIIKVCLSIGEIFNSAQLGINILGICQIVIMDLILSYFVYWLYKRDFSNTILVMVTIFFGCFKLIPMYALSMWKDTPFSLALFLYIITIAQIVYENGRKLNDKKQIVQYCILIFAISFLRGNGFYIALASTIMVLIVYRKNKISKFLIAAISTLCLAFIIKGPIFSALNLNDTTGGWNAVMINQIFYVKVNDGNITEEQNNLINSMCETTRLKEVYRPLLLDATTVDPAFNKQFIATNNSQIKQLWFELMIQNPVLYVKAYLLNTLGFWNVNRVFPDAYMSNFMWPGTEEIIDVQQTDYIEKWMGQSIIGNIQVTKLYSSAIFLFIMLASMIFTIKNKRYKNLLIYLPALFTWGTIVLATPIAFSLRYVYILVLITPVNFIIPFIKGEETKLIEGKIKNKI